MIHVVYRHNQLIESRKGEMSQINKIEKTELLGCISRMNKEKITVEFES